MFILIIGIILAALLIAAGFSLDKVKTFLPIAAGVLILAFLFSTFVSVPSGHVGVTILFGKVDKEVLPEGLHLINPLKNVYRMSVRTQEIFEHADVPSKEGLNVGLEVSLLYRILPENASDLYRNIGEKYSEILIIPLLRSAIRDVTVNHEAKELYTSVREIISDQIFSELDKNLKNRGIIVEAILLRKISLPDQVQQAINNKLAAEQEAERMKFVILKEEQEAKRKSIEAKGIADFQNIVRQGIDEKLLKWKSLETVNELAKSSNTKFVILGDKSGLPIIVQP